jgi:hypothetical protein
MTTAFIKSGEAMIIQTGGEITALAAESIAGDMLLACYNPVSRTLGIARNPDIRGLPGFINGILNPHDHNDVPVLQIHLIGRESHPLFKDIVRTLLHIDDQRNILNIVSTTQDDGLYPESVRMTAFDGNLAAL